MIKDWMHIIIIGLQILLCASTSSAQAEECAYLPFGSPVWDSDHNIIAVSGCSGVQFYDSTLQSLTHIEIPDVRRLALSPNGDWLAAATREQTVFIDIEKLEIVFAIDGEALEIVWHPGKSWLASYSYDDSTLWVIDADSQEVIYEQQIDHLALSLNWRGDGYLNYVGLAHQELYQWLPGETSEFIQKFPIPMQYSLFQASVWSPDDTRFAFMLMRPLESIELKDRGPLGIWDIKESSYSLYMRTEGLRFNTFMGISWHPGGDFIALSTWESVYILDAATLEVVLNYPIREIDPTHEIQLDECRVHSPADVNQLITWNNDGTQILITSWCRLAIFPVELDF